MKITNIVLGILIVALTGCTTIGQQISNKDGVVQVHQQQSPVQAFEASQPTKQPKKVSTNSVTKVTIPNPEEEILVEITESVISRQYIL